MKPLCSFDSSSLPIVIDASVSINLNATGRAQEILSAIANEVLMVDIVRDELIRGGDKGRPDAELTSRLIRDRLITVVRLGDSGWSHFEQLVSGEAAQTLDDGEAATIAYALEVGAIALIDERKATRLCAKRFADLELASTVDLLAHPHLHRVMGRDALANAVFLALLHARMSVQPHHVDWVTGLIGPNKTAQCKSLPKSIRIGDGPSRGFSQK